MNIKIRKVLRRSKKSILKEIVKRNKKRDRFNTREGFTLFWFTSIIPQSLAYLIG